MVPFRFCRHWRPLSRAIRFPTPHCHYFGAKVRAGLPLVSSDCAAELNPSEGGDGRWALSHDILWWMDIHHVYR
jgi:hypothetical protein